MLCVADLAEPDTIDNCMLEVKQYLAEFHAVLFRVQMLYDVIQRTEEGKQVMGPADLTRACNTLLFWQLYSQVHDAHATLSYHPALYGHFHHSVCRWWLLRIGAWRTL